ncbi:MAG: M18 family aminopeptidase [Clostridiales bacterium]|jgi:aspartyl aminopeptidase|nr:M18 family aminopeptidase [Clostridiales bacterium]
MCKEKALELIDFIGASPSVFHVADNIKKILLQNNYTELKEPEKWDIKKHGKYFVTKNSSAVIAFEIGEDDIENYGFRLIGAHNDSPAFKIKPDPEIEAESTYIKLNTETYGSSIYSTWFDRPLSIAGKAVLKTKDLLKPEVRLVDIKRPLVIIPSLAPHLARDAANICKYNPQVDLLPVIGLINENLEKGNILMGLLSENLNAPADEILDFELYLYDCSGGQLLGINEEFISACKLDDLYMVNSVLRALINSGTTKPSKVGVFLDNEEVGSKASGGAESSFLQNVLRRVMIALNKGEENYYRSISNSIMISADLAHGVHHNYGSAHDLTNRPSLGKGPVIKYSSNKRYSTDSFAASVYIGICEENNIPFQKFVNRSDLMGGSSMGPAFSKELSVPVIDVGAPVLSMHSIRELGAVEDISLTEKSFIKFFEL